jgi:hypothetical protein
MERISLAILNYGENDMNTHASNDVYVWNFILFLYKFSEPTQTVGTEIGIFFACIRNVIVPCLFAGLNFSLRHIKCLDICMEY